jgi:hypothetical protein
MASSCGGGGGRRGRGGVGGGRGGGRGAGRSAPRRAPGASERALQPRRGGPRRRASVFRPHYPAERAHRAAAQAATAAAGSGRTSGVQGRRVWWPSAADDLPMSARAAAFPRVRALPGAPGAPGRGVSRAPHFAIARGARPPSIGSGRRYLLGAAVLTPDKTGPAARGAAGWLLCDVCSASSSGRLVRRRRRLGRWSRSCEWSGLLGARDAALAGGRGRGRGGFGFAGSARPESGVCAVWKRCGRSIDGGKLAGGAGGCTAVPGLPPAGVARGSGGGGGCMATAADARARRAPASGQASGGLAAAASKCRWHGPAIVAV